MIRHKNYTEVKYNKHGDNRLYLYKDGTLINQFPNIKYCHEYLLENDKDYNVTYNALYRAIIDNKKGEYKGYNFEWFSSYRDFNGVELPIYKPTEAEKQEIRRELKGKIDESLFEELIQYLYEGSENNE